MSPARREALEGVLYISPWIIGFLIFTLGPMVASLVLSFTHYNILRPPSFIGLDNYVTRLHARPPLLAVARRAPPTTPPSPSSSALTGSLLLAILLNQRLKGTTVLRTLFFLPSLTPIVASALLWGWILQPDLGLVNYLLEPVRHPGPRLAVEHRVGDPGAGHHRALGRPRRQPDDHLPGRPAGRAAGAVRGGRRSTAPTRWQRFRHVTLPMISPTIFFNLVLGRDRRAPGLRRRLRRRPRAGRPTRPASTCCTSSRSGFQDFDMGYASALAWIFFVDPAGASRPIQFRLQRRWVYYEGESGR